MPLNLIKLFSWWGLQKLTKLNYKMYGFIADLTGSMSKNCN